MSARIIISLVLPLFLFLSGCQSTTATKEELYPLMYGDTKHQTVLVAPIINKSTSAEAGEYLYSTLAEPFANAGYYILPIPVTSYIFKEAGVVDGVNLDGVPMQQLGEKFGADAVLFVTINSWSTDYVVVAGSVTVGLEYSLFSTSNESLLWSYKNTIKVDTSSSSSGSLIADLIATAISTATTEYIPIARKVNEQTTSTIPLGLYHPRHNKDGKNRVSVPKEGVVTVIK